MPALFWDAMPDDPENPDLAALEALKEESTPYEIAESCKVRCIAAKLGSSRLTR